MAVISLPNGIGESAGDALVTNKPLEFNGNIWYVNATGGTDAASPAGQNRNKPLATLAQAVTNSADGDMIVCMDGHAETLTAVQTIGKDLTIVGAGSSSGKPTVKFTMNNASNATMFNCTGGSLQSVQLINLWIEENAQTNTAARIINITNDFRARGLYVECGATDTGAAIDQTGTTAIFESCTFISTATAVGSQPKMALDIGSMTTLYMNGVVVDAGTVGFSNYFALEGTDDISMMYIENLSLLRGADAKFTEASKGYINVQTATGGARIDWCDVATPA